MAYPSSRPTKRKLTLLEDGAAPRPKRISPFLNTPKQRREEKRKVLRMSIQKLRQIDDPECLLHRSVLINNTMKRMQNELREEKPKSSHWWSHWEVYGETTVSDTTGAGNRGTETRDEKLSHFDYEMINNDHLAFNSHLFDNDPDVDKMTKEMTEALCKTVDSIDRDHSSWSAKHESVVISSSSSCSSPSSTAAAAASSSDDEPLNLSTPKRTKDTSVQSSSCDSQKVDSTSLPSKLRQVCNDTTAANSCLCLSLSVCDCDNIISKDPAPVCDFSDLSMDTTSTHKQSESSFFSINSVNGAATSSDTSTSCFDNFGKVDFDFDCFPSVSDHERHMNEFDAVFNNLISVLTGS